jgi:hypothetical protein
MAYARPSARPPPGTPGGDAEPTCTRTSTALPSARGLILASQLLIGCHAAPVPRESVGNVDRPAGEAAPKEPPAPVEEPGEAPSDLVPPTPNEVPREPAPVPEGTVVLHIGSSSALALGLSLKKELDPYGTRYVIKAEESSYIPQWAGETMGLGRLVAEYSPDLVLITLGGNEAGIPEPHVRAGAIQRLVKIIGDRPCVWIGTPKWKRIRQTGIHEVIRENCAPCLYIDTDALVPDLEPHADGVHPTMPERDRWAEAMHRWLRHNRDPEGVRRWDFREDIELPP